MKTDTQTDLSNPRIETSLNHGFPNSECNTECVAESRTGSSLPFTIPHSSGVATGEVLELYTSIENALWLKLDVPQLTKNYYVTFDMGLAGGLRISFNRFGPDCGSIVIRIQMPPYIDVQADTILHTLEGATESNLVFSDAEKAIAWVSYHLLGLCQLENFWSAEDIFAAIQKRN